MLARAKEACSLSRRGHERAYGAAEVAGVWVVVMQLAPMAVGRISMQYRRTECTPPEKLKVQINGDSGAGGWLRLNVQKTAGSGGIASVQIKGSNTNWFSLTNKWGDAWETANAPSLPWDFRFVSDDKQEVGLGILPTS